MSSMRKKRRFTKSSTGQHLSSAQERVLHLWPLVTLRRSKNGTVKVVQETSLETPIVSQRLRSDRASAKKIHAARQRMKRKMAPCIRGERARCNYSLRTWAFSTYTDSDMLCSEDVTYCKNCQKCFFGVCYQHCKLVINREVVRDGSVAERARLTAPWPLYVAESVIPGAGEGVWTSATLPSGLVFGPYEGVILSLRRNSKAADSGYAWHLKSHKKSKVYIDSLDKSTSNWLRYVNCARNTVERNLEAFQYKRNVYYITLREIESNSELFVWYGDEYGRELGILGLSNNTLSVSPSQEATESFQGATGLRNLKGSTQANPLSDRQAPHTKMQLSKPQSALQNLFLPARLEPKEDHAVRVVYVDSTDSHKIWEESSEGAVRKHTKYVDIPPQLSSVRFNQKYNCKYNHAYCVECSKTYSGLCPKHPMTLILDKPVLRDGSIHNRAELTAPWPLYIAKSKVEDAGQGVWTSATLPQGLVFGPCEGCIVKRSGKISGYSWEVRGRPDIEIDAKEASVSSWGRYINCARNYMERNLIAMQIQNEIFYVTNTEIDRNTELMVWYGASYGSFLGIYTKDFFKPQLKETELERWCCDCQVLFTSSEFLSKHQERCRQSTKAKGKKRTLEDSNSLLHQHLRMGRKPQRRDRGKTAAKDFKENFPLRVEDVSSKTQDSISDHKRSDAFVSCDSSSDQSGVPTPIAGQPGNNITTSSFHKPEFSRVFYSGCAPECISSHYKSSMQKSAFDTVTCCNLLKEPPDCVVPGKLEEPLDIDGFNNVFDKLKKPSDLNDLAKPVQASTESLVHFSNRHKNPYPDASDSCVLPIITTVSSEVPNVSPVIQQDSQGFSDQLTRFQSAEIVNEVSLNSKSDFLDNFLDHTVPFTDSLDLEDSVLSHSPKLGANSHTSHFSEMFLQDIAREASGCSSVISLSNNSNCDHRQSRNAADLSSPSGLIQCSHKSGCPTQRSSRESTGIETSNGQEETEKPGHIGNTINTLLAADNMSFAGSHGTYHFSQSGRWGRKCSCHDKIRIKKLNMRDASQGVSRCHSWASNCSHPVQDDTLQRTFKNNLSKVPLQLLWKSREFINCRWRWSNHSTVQQHGPDHNSERKCAHGKEVENGARTTCQPQKSLKTQVKPCIHSGVNNICPNPERRETTINISTDIFYNNFKSKKVSCGNMIPMSEGCSNQVRHSRILDHGRQGNPSSLHQKDQGVHGEGNKNNKAYHSGLRWYATNRKKSSFARAHPFMFQNKNHENHHSKMCLKNGNSTLYECYRCGRKFASKYNLHEHQYLCTVEVLL